MDCYPSTALCPLVNTEKLAQFVADSSASAIDKVGVVFVMTIDPGLTSTAFADIGQLSYFAEEAEVLFSMHSVFRIDHVTDLGNSGRLWEVGVTLTTDDDPQLRLLAETMDEDIKTSTGWERIGRLLMSVGEVEKAEELYLTLLKQASSDSDRANHNHHLGWVKDAQGDYKEALLYYEKALDMMQKTIPANHGRLATTYGNIGTVYSKMGEYDRALLYHEEALHMQQATRPANHPDLATSHNNIGWVYSQMGQYSTALLYCDKALHMRQAIRPINHPDLATSHSSIGAVYSKMGEYEKALSYYEKALDVQQKTLPADHPDLSTSHNNIGSVYSDMGEYLKALSHHEKALDMWQKTLPADHPDLSNSHNNIGSVYSNMGEYLKALSFYVKALDMRQKKPITDLISDRQKYSPSLDIILTWQFVPTTTSDRCILST